MPPRLKNWLIGMSKFKHPELFIYSWFRAVSGWSTAETQKIADEVSEGCVCGLNLELQV